jgi:hypothetical protein
VRGLGVPAVLAMTAGISVASAAGLAPAFYRRLLAHGEPDRALVEAYAGLAGRPDIEVPVPALFSRLRGARLFHPASPPNQPEVEEVLAYLDALAEQAARLPAYFPARPRQAESREHPFDSIRQMVQVVADRSAWDRWRAEERERVRAAGLEDRLAYAPGRSGPEERLEEGYATTARPPRRRSPGTSTPPPGSPGS